MDEQEAHEEREEHKGLTERLCLPLAAQIARIDERTISIDESIKELKTELSSHYVTKQEFEPVKKLVYGVAALILSTVIVAILALVIATVPVDSIVKH